MGLQGHVEGKPDHFFVAFTKTRPQRTQECFIGTQDLVAIDRTGARGEWVASETLIRALVAAQLYDQALQEVQYAQRIWGDAPVLQATFA